MRQLLAETGFCLVVGRPSGATRSILAEILILRTNAVPHFVAAFFREAGTLSAFALRVVLSATLGMRFVAADMQVFELIFLIAALGVAVGTCVALGRGVISLFPIAQVFLKVFFVFQLFILRNQIILVGDITVFIRSHNGVELRERMYTTSTQPTGQS